VSLQLVITRVEELTVPVDEPGRLLFIVVALFLNPETSLLIVVDVSRGRLILVLS
jgi:hypothetical protein